MKHLVAKIHPADNVLVALTDLPIGTPVTWDGVTVTTTEKIPAKHKLALHDFAVGDEITMYGVLVGKMSAPVVTGGLLTTGNLKHATNSYQEGQHPQGWAQPNVSQFEGRTFMGYHRPDGRVGTANYWLVIPLVFCENRNIQVLEEALVNDLGYARRKSYQPQTQALIELMQAGKSVEDILATDLQSAEVDYQKPKLFPNVDGIRFLNHEGGCGGTRQDAQALCGLLAGYITHPNVAGATVLSLGCQNAQATMLQDEIKLRDPNFSKPLFILDQQTLGTEETLVSTALRQTFAGLMQANQQ
jgi:altronate hydrolase